MPKTQTMGFLNSLDLLFSGCHNNALNVSLNANINTLVVMVRWNTSDLEFGLGTSALVNMKPDKCTHFMLQILCMDNEPRALD